MAAGFIIANDGDKIVNTIAQRDAISSKFDGMEVTVIDSISDVLTGGGRACYKWLGGVWQLMWKDNKDNLLFKTEQTTIVGSSAFTTFPAQDGVVFNIVILDASGNDLLHVYNPTVIDKEIQIGSDAYDGHDIIFSYGYGLIQAAVSAMGGMGGVSSYNDLTDKPTGLSAFANDVNYLTTEVVTSLELTGNVLSYVNETGATKSFDLSVYLDNNVSAVMSASYSNVTKLMTFTREDNTTFTLDASVFFDDTNLVTSVNGRGGAVSIKTVNGQDIMGEGDITISGGGTVDNAGVLAAIGFTPSNQATTYTKTEVDSITGDISAALAALLGA
jgi:hypothetical protein